MRVYADGTARFKHIKQKCLKTRPDPKCFALRLISSLRTPNSISPNFISPIHRLTYLPLGLPDHSRGADSVPIAFSIYNLKSSFHNYVLDSPSPQIYMQCSYKKTRCSFCSACFILQFLHKAHIRGSLTKEIYSSCQRNLSGVRQKISGK
jgi:hypothetical protein